MPLGLLELIRRVGEGNVKLQNLESHLVRAQEVGKRGRIGTNVTFYTQETNCSELLNGDGEYMGLVLWLPREAALKAKAEYREPEPLIEGEWNAFGNSVL